MGRTLCNDESKSAYSSLLASPHGRVKLVRTTDVQLILRADVTYSPSELYDKFKLNSCVVVDVVV